DAVAADGSDLAPARGGSVSGLDAVEPSEHTEQVIPRGDPPSPGDRVRSLAHDGANLRDSHRLLREDGDIVRRGVMPAGVEAVGSDEVRALQPELLGLRVHHR